ncbi:radical SAM protein [Streptomyces inhibens]|uniref:Radical SAM protein n=1 Tax=Streptomyces inhibens TaxID=2293571 RepID=A0A371Q6Y1_STRIH|nr:radical SAM protein [Streptomyces inhibens]REK90419.1 radical SAM protein [Streptomyces inhibens]
MSLLAPRSPRRPVPQFAWLEISSFCNLECRQCYADSSPRGDHGTMTEGDWVRVMDELTALGVRDVQFIGGEPTLHPSLPRLIRHARTRQMRVEVFSNLTHITDDVWEALRLPHVRLAFSYYSDDAQDHDDVTQKRGSHARTRANVEKAKSLGIPMRGSVIKVLQGQRADESRRELLDIGLRDVRTDTIRPFGRGVNGAAPDIKKLCGRCRRDKIAISPNGDVWPCVFARWMTVGNVHEQSLQDIYHGVPMQGARAELAAAHPDKAPAANSSPSCLPDCNPSFDTCSPQLACAPDAACNPTEGGDERLREPIMSPHRSVRYGNPRIAGTDC